jgi:hypothetical protein
MLNSSLGKLLVGEGLLTETDRMTIRRTCGTAPSAFAKGILALGVMAEDELAALLADKTNYPIGPKDLLSEHDNDVFRVIDPSLAARLEVFPLSFQKDSLRVAVTDPLDRNIIRQLEFFTDKKIKPVIAPLSEIRRCLKQIVRGYIPQPTDLENFLIHHAPSASRQLVVERNPYLKRSERKTKTGAPPSTIRVPGQYTSSEQDDRFAAMDIGPDFAAPPVSGRDRELESLSFLSKARGVQQQPQVNQEVRAQSEPKDRKKEEQPVQVATQHSSSSSDEFELDSDLSQDFASETEASITDDAQSGGAEASLDLTDNSSLQSSGEATAEITTTDLEDLGDLNFGESSGSGGIDLSDLDDIGGSTETVQKTAAKSDHSTETESMNLESELESVEDELKSSEAPIEDLSLEGSETVAAPSFDLDEAATEFSSDVSVEEGVASTGESQEELAASDQDFSLDDSSTEADPGLDDISASAAPTEIAAQNIEADLSADDTILDAPSIEVADVETPTLEASESDDQLLESVESLSLESNDEFALGDIPIQPDASAANEISFGEDSSGLDISPAAESDLNEIGSTESSDSNDPTQVLSTLNQAMIRSSLSLPGPQNLQTVAGAMARHLSAGIILSVADGIRIVGSWDKPGAPIKSNAPMAAEELQSIQNFVKGISMPWMAVLGDDAKALPGRLASIQSGESPVLVCVSGKSIMITTCSLDLIRNEAFQLAVQTLLKKLEVV